MCSTLSSFPAGTGSMTTEILVVGLALLSSTLFDKNGWMGIFYSIVCYIDTSGPQSYLTNALNRCGSPPGRSELVNHVL
jgi:hypothetical protein